MIVNWPKIVAKMVLNALLLAMVFMVIVWAVVLIQSNNQMQNLLSDLVLIVSEENCLSEEGGADSTAAMFAMALEESETSWLTFETGAYDDNPHPGRPDAVLVCQRGNPSVKYNSYATAPQRGGYIHVELRGTVDLPVIIAPFGQERLKIEVPFTKKFDTMGLKYFKDKS